MALDAEEEVGREPKRQRGNSPPAKRKKRIFEIDAGWGTDMFECEIDRMIPRLGKDYFGDVRNSKGFDMENDTPLVKRWMHPVDHLQGPQATIIERCACVAVHHYNVPKKGKKILKFDKVVKATLAIKCIRV